MDCLSKHLESEYGVQDDSEKLISHFIFPFKCDLPPFSHHEVALRSLPDQHENFARKDRYILINRCSKLSYQDLSPSVPTKPSIHI